MRRDDASQLDVDFDGGILQGMIGVLETLNPINPKPYCRLSFMLARFSLLCIAIYLMYLCGHRACSIATLEG